MKIAGVFEDVGPRWSHDGARIAFFRHTTDRKFQLCVATADLSRVTPLLEPELLSPDRPFRTSRTSFRAPECLGWSPDDGTIVFPRVEWMTFPDGEKLAGTALWKIDVRTRKTSPLAVHPEEYKGALYHYRSPDWSPDGRHIVFIAEGLRGESALVIIPAAGAQPEIESTRPDTYLDSGWPAWSPNGKRLVFRQGIRRSYTADLVETIRVTEPGGLDARRAWATTPERYDRLVERHPAVETARPEPQRSAPRIAGICWSPDGKRVAFTVSRDAADPLTSTVWVLELGNPGAEPEAVPGTDALAAPVWLDRESLGAIQSIRGGGYRLVRIGLPPDSGPGSAVTPIADMPSSDFDWSPDRRMVVAAGVAAPSRSSQTAVPQPGSPLRLIRSGR